MLYVAYIAPLRIISKRLHRFRHSTNEIIIFQPIRQFMMEQLQRGKILCFDDFRKK